MAELADMANMAMGGDAPEPINDDMDVGTINVFWFPQLYWIFVGSTIAAFSLVNACNYIIFRQRLHVASRSQAHAARPRTFVARTCATITAVTREISNASLPSFRYGGVNFLQPTIGKVSLVLANAALLLALNSYDLSPSSYFDYENTAYRAGFLSLGQMPLIFLLAGKNNIIGWLIGSSYERLNWLHRWVARTLLLTTTLHMAFWFRSWARYDYISSQFARDPSTQTGFAAWCVLLWIVFSSFAPVRGWSYELFVLQHVVSMTAFVILLFLHTPSSDHGWLWSPVAIYFLDRVTRAAYAAYINLSVFHPAQRQSGDMHGVWSCKAELRPLPFGVTKVTIRNPPTIWRPGQHAFISCHSIVPLQSHPFTISSIPSDGKLDLLIKARKGGTKRFQDSAKKAHDSPSVEEAAAPAEVAVAIEGPYGRMRPLRQFDSVVLIAGSTGATFTVPLLRDLVSHWKHESDCSKSRALWQTPAGAVTRNICFNWIVKSKDQLQWFAQELADVIEDVKLLRRDGKGVSVDINAYVTCDETLTADFSEKTSQPPVQGFAQLVSSSSLGSDADLEEEKKTNLGLIDDIRVREIDSRLDSGSDTDLSESRQGGRLKTCQPDGTCCCRTAIESSADSGAVQIICACSGCLHTPKTGYANTSPKPDRLHRDIKLRSGRPTHRHLLVPALEAAQGETAVVACGPTALTEEIRRATVALSDERAVHKGTGAQGIWFWGECFGY